MEDIVIASIMIFLLVFTVTALAADLMHAHGALGADLALLVDMTTERQQTSLEWVQGATDGDNVRVLLRNRGGRKLAGFNRWDVVLHYYSNSGAYYVKWLPYREGAPNADEWTVEGIYLDQSMSTPEYYDLGIVNPGEYVHIWVAVQPPPKVSSPKFFILCTNAGACLEEVFTQ